MLPDGNTLTDTIRSARQQAGRMLLGLDFDGTLAPIVPRPEDAAMPPGTRAVLEDLASRADTLVALVSGRGLEDLRQRVGVDTAFYAGNHGLEIDGPGVHRLHPGAADAADTLAALAADLCRGLEDIAGVIVEDKGLTLSVHYRMVADAADAAAVEETVRRTCEGVPGVRLTRGKKVVEVRPDVDWHKGRALAFLRDTLLPGEAAAPALFIGDDRTDEDAFRMVGDAGFAIFVGTPPATTAAHAALASTDEVAEFLRALAQ